jgi:hypothetical protein
MFERLLAVVRRFEAIAYDLRRYWMVGFPECYTIAQAMLSTFEQELTVFVIPCAETEEIIVGRILAELVGIGIATIRKEPQSLSLFG